MLHILAQKGGWARQPSGSAGWGQSPETGPPHSVAIPRSFKYTVLSLATKRSWRGRDSGERLSQTTWHCSIVWGNLGEFAETLTKGAHVRHREIFKNWS